MTSKSKQDHVTGCEEEEEEEEGYLPPRPMRLRVTPMQRRGTDRAVREFL